MELNAHLHSPAALRAGAKFLNELAAIQEEGVVDKICGVAISAPSAPDVERGEAPPQAEPAAEETKERKPRGKSRTAAAVEAPPAAQPDDTRDAPADTPPADAPQRTHDDIRVLIGKLSQEGKREAAVALVRGFKGASSAACNGVKDIQPADVAAVWAALDQLDKEPA